MSLAYIRKTYGVPAYRGSRVTWHQTLDGVVLYFEGVITAAKDAHIAVRLLDDDYSPRYRMYFHPKHDGLSYVGRQARPNSAEHWGLA